MEALLQRGHEVQFFTPVRQYPPWLYPGADDRDPDACRRLSCAQACLEPLAPWTWPRGRRAARQAGADAWILPYWTWAWAGWWLYLLGGRRPPAVAVVHNPADHGAGAVRRLAARLVLGRCQALFTHAESLAAGLRATFPGALVAAHPLGVRAEGVVADPRAAREALSLPQGRRLALFLGLIRPYKGVDLLLDALAAQPAGTDWFLVVAGEPWGDLGVSLERQVDALGLSERVRLDLRWIPEPEVGTFLAAADLVVLPYRNGSQSAVAPLALGHGVPVLSTRVGGLPEVVEADENGLLVPASSVEALATALVDLDPATLRRLAAGARATASRLTWDAYAAALERLLAQTRGRVG